MGRCCARWVGVAAFLAGACSAVSQVTPSMEGPSFAPLGEVESAAVVGFNPTAFERIDADNAPIVLTGFSLPGGRTVDLEVERFTITTPRTRFVVGRVDGPDIPFEFDASSVVLLRGRAIGHEGSRVFLGLSRHGSNGQIDLGPGGGMHTVSSRRTGSSGSEPSTLYVRSGLAPAHPSGVPHCGTPTTPQAPRIDPYWLPGAPDSPESVNIKGLQQVQVAVETDYEYFEVFGNLSEAGAYVVECYGIISDVYIRDVNARVDISFVRLWDTPQDLFNEADPLGPFRSYWNANMRNVARDTAQFFTGRRDLAAGGVAYLRGLCNTNAYSWAGYIVGFIDSLDPGSIFNRDASVAAHELGHNCASSHTQDYGIDQCHLTTSPARRGTIMSYCGQTLSGGNANMDLRFCTHTAGIMNTYINQVSCAANDCNQNGVLDSTDITNGTSVDANANGIPDECEDCNSNGVLDTVDIAGGTSRDLNANTIPDECEPDCNNNGRPDSLDIADGISLDVHLNGVPDECEEDCDNNSIADYNQIQDDMSLDINRNARLDECEDCDEDGINDVLDLEGSHNVFMAGAEESEIREFYFRNGVQIRDSGAGAVTEPNDLLITPDGRILVTSGDTDRVAIFDRFTVAQGDLVAPGTGGLDTPGTMLLSPSGELLVASGGTNSVLRFNAQSGAPLGALVAPGAGGLSNPFGLALSPTGSLLVTSGGDAVLEFNITTGAFIRTFVTAGAGGLSNCRSLVVNPFSGNVLVCSYATNEVLEYHGTTGTFMKKWNRVGTATVMTMDQPWGIRVGPDGDIYVSRNHADELHLTEAHIYQFDRRNGNFKRAYVEGNDIHLHLPTGFDFYPDFGTDSNMNGVPDNCECYADCDRSTGTGVLDIFDFLCFQNRFAASEPYACDCDTSTGPNVCDIFDFLCFQNAFAGGCP